ncbi:uncharacterized protein [Euwallacea similis]|uniref:uncharacterized protein n=1 Tax=Euwallacea similis TaxID=1736056 RepID=UPI0034502EB9
MVEDTDTLTCRDGLAYVIGSSAGPTQTIRSNSRDHSPTQSGSITTTQYTVTGSWSAWWSHWWDQKNCKWMERMEKGRSNFDQQSMEEQNGKWNKKTIRKRRSLHYIGPPNRRRHGCHRLLVIRQLLVSGSGHWINDCGLTTVQRSSRWRATRSTRRRRCGGGRIFRRGRGKFVSWGPIFKSRERLASRRGIRKRCPESLTPCSLRKERWCNYG